MQDEVKGLHEAVNALNILKISFEINSLQGRFDELNSCLSVSDTSASIRHPAAPNPEVERFQRQLETTERELRTIRNEAVDVSHRMQRNLEWSRKCETSTPGSSAGLAMEETNVSKRWRGADRDVTRAVSEGPLLRRHSVVKQEVRKDDEQHRRRPGVLRRLSM